MAGRAKATSTTDARHRQSGRADSGRGSRESSHDRAQCRFASGDAAGRRCRRDCPAVVSANGERQCPGAREGLSCTRFEYANLLVSLSGPAVRLTVDLTNVGDRAGRKVVQFYVRNPASTADEPERELREFAKLALAAGQTRTAAFDLPSRAFAHWDVHAKAWMVTSGQPRDSGRRFSRDIRRTAKVSLSSGGEQL